MNTRELTREEFINHVADWRPEYRMQNNMLLGAQGNNKIGFYVESHNNSVYFVLKNYKTGEVLYRVLHPALIALKE